MAASRTNPKDNKMVIPINDETIAEVPNTSCCEERHKANEKFHGFVCECPCHQSKPCCERPRKTVSVSTLKGRRAICNNCGADWPQSSHSKREPREIEDVAANIVYQIGDVLYEALPPDMAHEHFVKARQNTNDLAIDFAKKLISKLLSDREKEIRRKCDTVRERAPSTKKMFDRGFAAGAEAERARILEQLPSLIEPMDSDLKKGAGYLAAELRSLLSPNQTTE